MSHEHDDENLNTLLQEIDRLMLRIGDQPPETLRQTGRFPQSSDIPKKFSQTPKKHQITTPKKVHIKSPSSSSSSSEEIRRKPRIKSSYNKSQCSKSKCSKSQCKSQISNKQSNVSKQYNPPPKQTIQTNDVFCVICEEFIPLQFVSTHQFECFESKEFNTKLIKLRDLLSMRYEMIQDEQLRTLVTIIHACTQNIIDSKDSYELQKCIDDFYVLKSQLNNFDEAYSVLTVTAKIQEVSNQKQQLFLTQFQPQQQLNIHPPESVISYKTNNTSLQRKRLFEQPKLNTLPKQLIQLPKSNNDTSTQISKKIGIEYGNQYNSSKKRQFITLSSGKKQNNTNTNNNENNNNNNNNNNTNAQLNQSPQRTLISGISSYFSRLGTQGNEENKKRFFDLAVRKKNQLPQNHAAQNILISEMYEQMRKQQICENEWNQWIDNIYIYA